MHLFDFIILYLKFFMNFWYLLQKKMNRLVSVHLSLSFKAIGLFLHDDYAVFQ